VAESPERLLALIAEAVDDGFYPASSLASALPKLTHREVVRLRKRALRQGLVLERRDPEGRTFLSLTSEGWRALRASDPG
jgi:DNA-binding MarR family transcriptional regulator